jgi:LmbE family N-acetylglucosaminyl deacetylase
MYDSLIIAPHPDDAETQMGGTIARLVEAGSSVPIIDVTTGEPTELAEAGIRAEQAAEAARILGVDRINLGMQDRFLEDSRAARIEIARLIREHRPRWLYGIGDACVHPDHTAATGLTRAAAFLARLGQWDRTEGGERLADTEPWAIERLFFPHCKMEPSWSEFAFAVDVSGVYERKRAALGCYRSIFAESGDRLLALYEAEDQYYGRMLGVAYAEIFRSASPLLIDDPRVFRPGLQG